MVQNMWGDLCQGCIDSMRAVDVNSLSFISELRDIASLIPKFSGWRSPKTWASVFLAYKYGITLTMSDIKALAQGIKTARAAAKAASPIRELYSFSRNTVVHRGTTYYDEYHYKVIASAYPGEVLDVIRSLDAWGLYPTPVRLWDMVPLSFVVDWVFNLSSLLERCDSRVLAQYYAVHEVCRSRKVSFNLPISQLSLGSTVSGTIVVSWYDREIKEKLDLPSPRIDQPGEFHNYAELTALIIALK
jgi:hypothetical protein